MFGPTKTEISSKIRKFPGFDRTKTPLPQGKKKKTLVAHEGFAWGATVQSVPRAERRVGEESPGRGGGGLARDAAVQSPGRGTGSDILVI